MTTAADLLRSAEAFLLDFDGPVADLMPPPVNAEAAGRAREALDVDALPQRVATTDDHLAVLRFAAEKHPQLLVTVERACAQVETEAARSAQPSVHAADLLAFAAQRGVPVALVSNNAEDAVRQFFAVQRWTGRVAAFSCRTAENVTSMKPDPSMLLVACENLGIDPARAVFVGDSVSDVLAGKACGMPVIGLAKHDQRAADLREAGAMAVVRLGDRAALAG